MKDARGSGAGRKSAGKALSLYPLTLEEVAVKLLITPPEPKAAGLKHSKGEGEKPRLKRRGTTK
jgi:hypothetical protein